jgi:fluoroacetyl-CoA thioesterase
LIERTARESLYPFLDAEERSVGMEIEIRHLAPTPPGATVTCLTRVIQVEGREISFQVEARDAHETIARGLHKRAVVRVGSFGRRVAVKAAAL